MLGLEALQFGFKFLDGKALGDYAMRVVPPPAYAAALTLIHVMALQFPFAMAREAVDDLHLRPIRVRSSGNRSTV